VAAVAEPRGQASFGGLVPSAALVRGGDTAALVLVVEHHAEGAALPILILSDAPGLLEWDPAGGLEVSDDRGAAYEVSSLAVQAGLGALQATAWLEPALPSDARRLRVAVRGIVRRSAGRRGSAARELSGGPWELAVDLLPPRTTAEPPPRPEAPPPELRPARIPARAYAALLDLVPIGQARLTERAAVCLWALERYHDRAVLSLGVLTDAPSAAAPGARGAVEVWDDAGNRHAVAPIHAAEGPGWSERSLEVVPAVAEAAGALAVRLDGFPGGDMTFGVALPGPAEG
jgi:hypothetical protein